MIKIALLDATLHAQMLASPGELGDVQVVISADQFETLWEAAPSLEPDVLILHLSLLGADPASRVRALRDHCGAELVIVTYSFGTRSVLRALESPQTHLLRAPVKLSALRMLMINLIVRDLFARQGRANGNGDGDGERQPRLSLVPKPRRYSAASLGRLQEIQSAIACECPNHLAALLASLYAFEDYTEHCESRNPEDARIHHMLHQATSKARMSLETALALLCEHENIILPD